MIYLEKIICTAGTFTVGNYPLFIEKENPDIAVEYKEKEIQAVFLVDPEELPPEELEEVPEEIVAFVFLDFSLSEEEEDTVLLPIFEDTGFSVKT